MVRLIRGYVRYRERFWLLLLGYDSPSASKLISPIFIVFLTTVWRFVYFQGREQVRFVPISMHLFQQ